MEVRVGFEPTNMGVAVPRLKPLDYLTVIKEDFFISPLTLYKYYIIFFRKNQIMIFLIPLKNLGKKLEEFVLYMQTMFLLVKTLYKCDYKFELKDCHRIDYF